MGEVGLPLDAVSGGDHDRRVRRFGPGSRLVRRRLAGSRRRGGDHQARLRVGSGLLLVRDVGDDRAVTVERLVHELHREEARRAELVGVGACCPLPARKASRIVRPIVSATQIQVLRSERSLVHSARSTCANPAPRLGTVEEYVMGARRPARRTPRRRG